MTKQGSRMPRSPKDVIDEALNKVEGLDPQEVVDALGSFLVTEVESGDRLRGLQAMRLSLVVGMSIASNNVVPQIQARLQSVIDEIDKLTASGKKNISDQLSDAFRNGLALVPDPGQPSPPNTASSA